MFGNRIAVWLSWGVLTAVLAAMVGAELVDVELVLDPPGGSCNRLNLTVSADAVGMTQTSTDTTTVTGTVKARLAVDFDRGTGEVVDVMSLEFTGGEMAMTPVHFRLDYGFLLGHIDIDGTHLGGMADSPMGPGAVQGGHFDTSRHQLVLNRGEIRAEGTGLVGTLFHMDPIDLSAEPLRTTSPGMGTVDMALAQVMGRTAIYPVGIAVPINFRQVIVSDNDVTVRLIGVGQLCGKGTLLRNYCPLSADLNGDCNVNISDLVLIAGQWLSAGCDQTADTMNQDCFVDIDDFAALSAQWMMEIE